jgi:poly(A) polymerase
MARYVGGCVRNTVMGLATTDIDIATVHQPEETVRRLEATGITAKPTGIAHGTITAIAGGQPFEITTLRRDVETDGRRAVVAFTDDWAEDAARRDFTMNAMFMDVDDEIHDPMHGHQDAIDGRVRFVGAPERRILEDALRILRFFRFQAQYGRGPLDTNGLDACKRYATLQTNLSGERVRTELLKLLSAPQAGSVARLMAETGILAPLFPVDPNLDALDRLIALEDNALIRQADPIRRLAALFAVSINASIEPLRFSKVDSARMLAMSFDRVHFLGNTAELKANLYKRGPARFIDSLLITAALDNIAFSETEPALALARTWIHPKFPLRGADLIKLGLVPGQTVGRILATIEKRWIADGMRGSHDICLSWARQSIEQDRNSP